MPVSVVSGTQRHQVFWSVVPVVTIVMVHRDNSALPADDTRLIVVAPANVRVVLDVLTRQSVLATSHAEKSTTFGLGDRIRTCDFLGPSEGVYR